VEEGKVKNAGSTVRAGTAVRVVVGEATGAAYVEHNDEAGLLAAARQAAAIARGGGAGEAKPLAGAAASETRYPMQRPLADVAIGERIDLLKGMSERAYAADERVAWVTTMLMDGERWISVAASDGTFAQDHQPSLVAVCSTTMAADGRREQAYSTRGVRQGYEVFGIDSFSPDDIADEAVAAARFNLEADPCPAGSMPVVLGAGGAGVLVHEAVGHGLEADFNRKGVSAYSGLVGEMVASPLVGIRDRGDLPGMRGSLNIDDEGVPVGDTPLIEGGRLVGYLHDKLSARLMGATPTGNGRRESYKVLPIPRMRITLMDDGPHEAPEIIASVKKGLFAKEFGGGSVDITKGDYNFQVRKAWLIEDGKLTRPVYGATLVGNGPETMRRISMVAGDSRIDQSAGTCGKDGQGAPVNFGQPTALVSELTVGGNG
jgi:TldD protein